MTGWLKQTKDNPLYPDVIWSRPDNPNGSGKILVIGGSAGNFANLAASFSSMESSGAGTTHVLVPDSLKKVTAGIPFINYAPSNPSGGFARKSLAEFLDLAKMVDGVFFAGDMGKNSETSLLLDDFLTKYAGWVTITPESIESFDNPYDKLLARENTVLFLNEHQLREMAIHQKSEIAVTSDISQNNLATTLKFICQKNPCVFILLKQNDKTTWVGHQNNLAECSDAESNPSKTTVWLVQQPEKPFQSIVSSSH